jgi:hypothetical protein
MTMRFATALASLLITSTLIGCGGSSTDETTGSGGNGSGGGNSSGEQKAGESCDEPLVLTDKYMGTFNFTESFTWGAGKFKPTCGTRALRPSVFIQWTADADDADSFKVYVNGSESVALEVFDSAGCSGALEICSTNKLPIGADHVVGAYVPIRKGKPITVVVVANESAAPSGDWTISMGD